MTPDDAFPDSTRQTTRRLHVMLSVNAAWNILNFRSPLVKAFLEDGHTVTVLAPPDRSVTELTALGCRFVPLDMDVKGLNPISGLRLIHRFRTIFKTERPDIVLSYTIKNNIFGAMAAGKMNIPFVPNVTGLGTAFLSGGVLQKLAETLYRRSFQTCPAVFFQNDEDRDMFINRKLVKADQARLLPGSGIDLIHFKVSPLPPQDESPVFLMIARLLRDKGVVEFAEAAQRVRTQLPGARFQLLGAMDAENRSAIDRTTLQSWVDEGRLEYLGHTDDVRPFILAAHCIVLPSYREGAPRTLIEASAMGRPVIATNVPGCRQVVEAGRTGILCEMRDAISLSEACLAFAALPRVAKQSMGTQGRVKMEHAFSDGVVIRAYRHTIAELTG